MTQEKENRMDHDVEVHLRKIEEVSKQIENDLGILRREVRLFLQHDSYVGWGFKEKEEVIQEDVTDLMCDCSHHVNQHYVRDDGFYGSCKQVGCGCGGYRKMFSAQGNVTEPDDIEGQMTLSSDRAKSEKPLPLSRAFKPSKVGFTSEMFSKKFPNVSPNDTLEKFLTFYISRGDVAVNWFEKFMNWSQEAERRALLAISEHRVETDSMGLPLDPKLRRRMNGSPEDPDAAQRINELKSKQDEIYESLTDEEKEMLP